MGGHRAPVWLLALIPTSRMATSRSPVHGRHRDSDADDDPTADHAAVMNGASVSYIDYDTVTGFTLAPPSGSYQVHTSSAQ